MTTKRTCLIGDLGGTNIRFKLLSISLSGNNYTTDIVVLADAYYASNKFGNFEEAIQYFLNTFESIESNWPESACFCIAGPVENQTSLITALNWIVSSSAIETIVGIKKCHLFNDFVGVGYGVLSIQSTDA